MTLHVFNALDEHEQAEAVWNGVLLADRIEGEYRYILYQLDGFYAELRYHTEHNVLTGLQAFEDTQELEPYLAQMEPHQRFGKPTATIRELRDKAIGILPAETTEEIINHDEKGLIHYHLSIGVFLRNRLNLWHTVVYDEHRKPIHPDEATQAIVKEIWLLNH